MVNALRAKFAPGASLGVSARLSHPVLEQNFAIASEMLNQRQCRAPDRTRVGSDRTRDNVDVAQAAPIQAGKNLSRARGETLAHRGWKRAVDHDRFKVDDGDRRDRRVGQSRRGILDPSVELHPEFAP